MEKRLEQLENFTSWLIDELLGWDNEPYRLTANALIAGFAPEFIQTIFNFSYDEWIEISEFADNEFLTQEEIDRVQTAILHYIEEAEHEA